MKTLKGIDEKIEWFTDDISDEQKALLPTYRKLMRVAVGGAAARNGEEALDYNEIGLKLRVDGDVDLEEAEFKLLKRACEEHSAAKRQDGWIAHIQAKVLLKLKDAEKEAKA